ncbi:Crp/Fnr family transcriptional regulator [Sulfurimonas sp.]
MKNNLILSTLQSSFIFQNAAQESLRQLAEEFQFFTFEKNKNIDFTQTDKYFFIVSHGIIKMTKMDIESGRSITLFLYSAGDVFDVLPLFDQQEHDVEFSIVKNSCLLAIEMTKMREWIKKDPHINAAFFSYLAREIRKLEDFSESMVFYDAKTRLIKFLLKEINTNENKNNSLLAELTHASLAEIIGSIRSVVTTELNKLKKEGFLIKKEGKLILHDLERLHKNYNHLFHNR